MCPIKVCLVSIINAFNDLNGLSSFISPTPVMHFRGNNDGSARGAKRRHVPGGLHGLWLFHVTQIEERGPVHCQELGQHETEGAKSGGYGSVRPGTVFVSLWEILEELGRRGMAAPLQGCQACNLLLFPSG